MKDHKGMKNDKEFVSKEVADVRISTHKSGIERRIVGFGNKTNDFMDTHHCILWGDWFEETDAYGHKSPNRIVKYEFYWQQQNMSDKLNNILPFTKKSSN